LIEKYDAIMRSWPVPCEERDIATAFGTTHVIACGPDTSPPLVMLHGAAATATMWSPIIAPLSESYRCYCVDTVTDANKSVATTRVRGVPDYVAWLREVFSSLGIETARVVGLSYGGWLAALLAVRAPQLVNRVLLLSPAGTLAPLTFQFFVRMLSSSLLRSPVLVRRSVQWVSSTPDAPSDPAVELIVASMLSCRTLRWEMMPPTVLTDDELRRFSAPTDVFIGDCEVIYRGGPEAALARAQKLIPNVRAHLVRGANHMLTLDAPELVVNEMTAALK
jgi:pimeloyl-ACP methyl ester carboxylesterase